MPCMKAGGRGTATGVMAEQGDADGAVRVSGSYDFTAPAEVVFGVLTDPDRTSRWLPRGMNAESASRDEARIRVGTRVHPYGVKVVTDHRELQWHSLDSTGLHGTAQVDDAPAGGSVVRAEVVVPAGLADDQQVRDLLAETMIHLQRDVSDNFNAG
jgi:uncharacterized protein YndB with AHSA1/START domain